MTNAHQNYLQRMAGYRWKITILIKIVLIALLSYEFITASLFAETIVGFVTRIDSSSEIEIGTMHMLITPETTCNLEVLSTNGQWSKATQLSQCTSGKMVVGSRILSTGHLRRNGKLIADHLEMRVGYQEPCQLCALALLSRTAPAFHPWTLQESALAEEAPILTRRNQGWEGEWWVDGYPISVDTQTQMLTAPNFDIMQKQIRPLLIRNPQLAHLPRNKFQKLRFSDLLNRSTWVFYHAAYGVDSTPLASWMLLSPNQVEAGEEQFLSKYIQKVRLPDYESSVAGSIQYSRGGPIQIVPDKGAQEYISKLGSTMIPKYRLDMLSTKLNTVDLRFYIIRPFMYVRKSYFVSIDGHVPDSAYEDMRGERFNAPVPGTLVKSVIAMPDGTILVPDVVLARLKNQAQAMALLSYAITSILQKQAFHAWPITRPHFWGSDTDFVLSYSMRYKDEQLLRIGIRQMYLAGYDIREAPYAWAVAQGRPANNPVINSQHPDKEIPWYAAYAFNYISQYYKDVDYTKLKRGEREYQQFLQQLRKADPEAFAPTHPTHP